VKGVMKLNQEMAICYSVGEGRSLFFPFDHRS
jgi:hypothetical protein